MNEETNYAEHFYAKISNDIATLEQNVNEYPFSSIARFLLLYHYKRINSASFEELARHTAIYFNNIPWIQHQLSGVNSDNLSVAINNEDKHNIEEPFGKSLLPVETDEEIIPVNEQINQNFNQQSETANDETKDVSHMANSIHTLGEDEVQEKFFTADEQIDQNFNQQSETANEETKDVSDIANSIHTLGEDEVQEKFFAAGEQINQNFNQQSENDEESIAFEPLHTVDYFASQGIKISEEALANDHLGQQVKSFTAWLKSMKKLHPGQLPEQNEVIEKIIQSSAEVSNQNANVLTEAMAEVLIKQGKKEKAIEMYQKLSLMNPSKSGYFAAKIESLKTI
jgi:tetratricopeptide (TPR) repeat protein